MDNKNAPTQDRDWASGRKVDAWTARVGIAVDENGRLFLFPVKALPELEQNKE